MLTPATISKTESKTEQYRKDAVERLCQGMSVKYFSAFLHGFYIGCDGVEEIYQKLLMQLLEGGRDNMKKKKSLSKLKLATTAKAKKLLKAKKK